MSNKMEHNNNSFGFTANVDEKVINKVLKFRTLEEILNKNLSMGNYSASLTRIVFVYIAFNPDVSFPEDDFKKYRRKTISLEVGINLDYDRLLTANEKQVLRMLAEAYLKGIREQMVRKDFDSGRFYVDVEKLFMQENLIPMKPTKENLDDIKRDIINEVNKLRRMAVAKRIREIVREEKGKATAEAV